jgi:hypothetical protein
MRRIQWLLVVSLIVSGCYHFPHRSEDQKKELVYLSVHGHSPDEVDLPHHAWLALLLDLVPIPLGIGHYYIGDVTDGLKGSLLFWILYPMFIGPAHAYSQASYENDVYYLTWAHEHGWFDGKKDPAKDQTPPAPTSGAGPVSSTAPASAPVKKDSCPYCGEKYTDPNATSCPSCGAKR